MKQTIFCLTGFALFLIFSCKRAVDIASPVKEEKDTIILAPPAYAGDSVVLNWSVPVDTNFSHYNIYRKYGDGEFRYIASQTSDVPKKFVDAGFSYAPVTEYMIQGLLNVGGSSMSSNVGRLQLDSLSINLEMPAATPDSVLLKWDLGKTKNLEKVSILFRPENSQIWYPRAEFYRDWKFTYCDTLFPYGEKTSYKISGVFNSGYTVESNELTADIPLPAINLEIVKSTSNVVELRWTKTRKAASFGYWVMRKPGDQGFSAINFYNRLEPDMNTYTDQNLPHAASISYQIVVDRPGLHINEESDIKSNVQTFRRPGIYNVASRAFDVQFLEPLRKLYFFEKTGRIIAYDIGSNTVSNSIQLNAHIGFCTTGLYNGAYELYVGSSDGTIYIYDANTFALKDQLVVGNAIASVAFSKNLLFVSTNAASGPLKIYDRALKSLKLQTGTVLSTRLKALPGGDGEFVEVPFSPPLNITYYRFDPSGKLLERRSDDDQIGPFDPLLFEITPDNKRIVSASDAVVYSVYGKFQGTFRSGQPVDYLAYAFNQGRNELYASTNYKQINIRSLDDYAVKTILYPHVLPLYLFSNGNQLISIGDVYGYPTPVYLSIEYWNL